MRVAGCLVALLNFKLRNFDPASSRRQRRQAPLHQRASCRLTGPCSISCGRLDHHASHAGRRQASETGPDTSVTSAPRSALEGFGDGVSLFTAGAIGQKPYRIQAVLSSVQPSPAPACPKSGRVAGGKSGLDRCQGFRGRLSHSAGSKLPARHCAVIGSDDQRLRRLSTAARLRWVAGWRHMRTFIAGAINTGLSVASKGG